MKRNTVIGASLLLGLTFTSGLCVVQHSKISQLEASLAENREPSKLKVAKATRPLTAPSVRTTGAATTPQTPAVAAASPAKRSTTAIRDSLWTRRGGPAGPALSPGGDAARLWGTGGGESTGEPGTGGMVDSLGGRGPRTAGGLVQWDHTQATGAPNTPEAGDKPTAWAPRSPKSGEQWLQLGYEKAVEMKEINIHESYSSGAISKVTAFMPDGTEKTLWTGNATPGGANEILETSVPVPAGITGSQIKVYVDTNRVGSWPEIDAVELVGKDGSRQWASQSSASSSYSEVYSNQEDSQTTTEDEVTTLTAPGK